MRKFALYPAVLLALISSLIFLAGCGGGGGGGGSSQGSLVYITDWTDFQTGVITGQSEKVSIFDSNNDPVVAPILVNQDVVGKQQIVINTIANGTYHIKVQLFSQRDWAGTETGEIDTLITVHGGSSFQTAVGKDVVSVKVVPASATLTPPESKPFYAFGVSGANIPTFIREDQLNWETQGNVATVTQDGVVTATSAGTGAVTAEYQLAGLTGAATLTVNSPNSTPTKWTVLVYMNAANDLRTFSTLNMNQMEKAAGNPQVRFVVQWKQSQDLFSDSSFDGTRRYLVKPDNTNAIASQLVQDMGTGVDMGQAQTLTDFINWGKTFYPADRYVVIIWNHGNGWKRKVDDEMPTRGVSYDDETGNAIQTWQLSQALTNTQFDIVAWDASLMQMAEVSYEIRDRAQYVVGSEESPPGEGYPYDTIFAHFRDNPDDTTLNLAKAFVDETLAVPAYASRKITQSVIDTSQLGGLATAVNALGTELINNEPALVTPIQETRNQTQAYSQSGSRVYRDLYDVCLKLEAKAGIPSVVTAAANVRTAIGNAVVYEGHNANSANSHGVSIDFQSLNTFNGQMASDYANLKFAQDTSWNEFLTISP